MKKVFIFLAVISFNYSFAQTGPGGVGNATGADGQPENIIWLDAGTIGVGDGADVVTWTDISGNGEIFSASSSGNLPSLSLNQVNGLPSVVFDDGNSERLNLNPFTNMATSEITSIVVFATANSGEAVLSYAVGGSNNEYLLFDASGIRTYITGPNSAGGTLNDGINTFNIFTSTWNSSGGALSHRKNGVQTNAATLANGLSITTGGSFTIGGEQDAVDGGYDTDQDLGGEIAEIIIFSNAINDAQRTIIENYLSEKYNITISNDFFSLGDASFNNDLTGIGTSDGFNKNTLSGFSDALQIEEEVNTLNAPNEYILFAHDNIPHDQTVVADFTDPEITDRWARSWFLEVSGGISAELVFDFGVAGLGTPGSASDYVLLYRPTTSDDYTRVLANKIIIRDGDKVVVDLSTIDLPTGYYTLGRGTQLVNTTYYSFQSGNWEDALTWTTDPSGDQRVPVSGNLPTANDNVVILSGRTVRMATSDNDGVQLTVNGRLDIENTSNHNYLSIEGNGIISIEGAAGVDNFPSGSTSNFADSIVGGTVLIEAGNFDLNTARVYNNVIVDLASPTNVVTLLSDYTINGDLDIQTGILQINDNVETTALTVDAFGDVQVDASGEINVGTANARHQFNFYGDFINSGRVEFTNRSVANFNSEATDGIVDANFLNDNGNQSIDCNGVTNFYRIEIDKGADETFILDVNSLSAANFNLLGPANYNHGSTAQLTTNDNALGLLRGTVRLNADVDVPLLNNSGNYNISEAARLWVNGGSTSKVGGEAIVPYGIIQVSDGTLDAPVRSGITTRDNGTIIVEGGVVTVNQIRTSVLGVENIGGYFQSGGTVNVTGQNVQQNYYTFSLTYPGNTFNMSGGTLRVAGSDTFNDNTGGTSGQIHGGGIFIDSDPGNFSVTGGTVIMENNTNVNFKVTSKAPFWNVIMRSTGGTATDVDLASGTSGDNSVGEFETILNPELLVLNNLTVEDGVSFDPNGNDIEVGSDLIIEDGAEWDVPLNTNPSAPYTLTLNGVDNSVLRLDHATQVNCPTCPVFSVDQRFSNLVINKPDGIRVTLDASAQRDAEIAAEANVDANNLVDVRGTFDLQNGIFDIDEYSLRLNTTDVRIAGILSDYVEGVSNVDAQVKFRAATFTVQNTGDAIIGNLRFRTNNDIVTLQNDLTVRRLQFESGLLNIEDKNLRVENFVEALRASEANFGGCAGGCYSVEDMIVTSGNVSDGGISILVDGNGTYEFPFGVGTTKVEPSSKYTPASVIISGFSDDGFLEVRPVDDLLPTTDPSGGDLLSYYWSVDFEGFTSTPTVEYQFTYYDDDLDGSSNESNFAAGKVLEQAPFDRDYEDEPVIEGVDDAANIITFNGPADTGFTLESASYTAGEFGRFVGAPEIYFSRDDGNWDNTNTWSTVGHTSAVNTGTFPQAGDVAIISFNGTNFHRVNAVGDVNVAILEFNSLATATAKNISLSRILFGTNEDLNAEIVRGIGELQFASNNGNGPGSISASSDLGDFVQNSRSSFIYTLGGTGDITIPTIPRYPSLRFFANGANDSSPKTERFFLDSDIECANLIIDGNAVLEVTSNILVTDTLFLGANRDGELIFNNGAVSNTVEIGNIIFGSDLFGAAREENVNRVFVEAGGGNGIEHRLIVNNNISIATGSGGAFPDAGASFDLYTNTTDNNVILELRGEGVNSFEIEGDDDIGSNGIQFIPEFYRIIIDKGTGLSSSFAFNDGFTLQGSTNTADKALTLLGGLLVLNSDDNDINIDLSTGGGDFDIPASTGLQITQATVSVSGDDTGIILDGSLIIDGGTLDMDDASGNGNNFIEYSASGNALLEISDGILNVGSQIRGITTAETGVLKYIQTGGDVRIGTQAGPENTRGMLQVYNTNSEFTFTGGTLQIERHQSSPSVAALFLNPDDSDVTRPIQIFNANTPAGQNDFRINSAIDLEDLIIDGTNSPSVNIDINPLTIRGDLTIGMGATLNGNGRTLTIGGDLSNDGTYDAQGNETVFNSATTQQITGSGTNTFFRLTKTEVGTLDLTSTLDVASLFTIAEGTVSDNGFSINLASDAVIDGIHSSTGGNGLVFSGGSAQEIRRSTAGTGTLGVVTVNNANGVIIPDGNGYNFNIDGGLRLENGIFNVGGSVIALGINALITPVNPFGISNMIRTNSSFTDGGVSKTFPANFNQDFVFPIGQDFYTPVSFDFTSGSNTSGSSDGTISIFPADEPHPTVNDGADFFVTGDVNNVLQYYWTVNANGVTGFTTDMTLGYDDSQVLSNEPGFDETDYIPARILTFDNPTDEINKFTTAGVDETNNLITFDFIGVSSNGITGDYFAGIDEAIPDNVTTYTVDVSGDFGDDVYDITVPGGGAPLGSVVIVPNGFTLTLDADNANFYRTEIQDGGVLEVDNSTNHRLGQLSGTGTLRILSDGINANLPAFSGSFLSCSGGGLEYGGSGDYSVLSGITELRNLSFIGSGNKSFANNDVVICEDLTVLGSGLTILNPSNRRITVENNLEIGAGEFNANAGFIIILNDLTISGGTYNHSNGGLTNINNDLTLSSGVFNSGTAGSIRLRGNLTYTGGTYNTGSGARTFLVGTVQQVITGNFVGASKIFRLDLNNPGGVSLNGNLEIDTFFGLTDGIVNGVGVSTVIFDSNARAAPDIGRSNSYLNSRIQKVLSTSSFNFPLGGSNRWRPATISNVSDAGLTWQAEYFAADPRDEPLVDNLDPSDPSIETISTGEYWIISDDTGTTPPPGVSATVGLSWGIESDVSPIFAEREELEVMIWNDGLNSWDNLDGTNFSSGHTQSGGRFTAVLSNSFSEQIFTLGSTTTANALPIELVQFSGETIEGDNYLTWVTASELNNDYFELQRSFDGINYETISRIEGEGTVIGRTNYEYVDENPLSGFNYYRLKQVDIDGTVTVFSQSEWIVLLTITSNVEFGFKVYPNPTIQSNINLELAADQNLPLTVEMIDLYGRVVYQKVFEPSEFDRDIKINTTQNLRQGVYIIVAEQNGKRTTKRLIISD